MSTAHIVLCKMSGEKKGSKVTSEKGKKRGVFVATSSDASVVEREVKTKPKER